MTLHHQWEKLCMALLLTILSIMLKQYLEERNLEDTFSLSTIS